MNKKTLKLTQGALMTAFFGALIILNRQTAGILEGVLIYAYAIPIAIYTTWYGLKSGLVATAAMVLLSFLFGTPTYAIYACLSLVIGLVFGLCLYNKIPTEKTILFVVVTAVITNLIDLAVMVFVTGVSLDTSAIEMQEMYVKAFNQAISMSGSNVNENALNQINSVFTVDFIKKILILSKALAGVLQGFLTYLIGSLIMRKLRIKIPKPKSLGELRPPVWTAYVALGCFFVFNVFIQKVFDDEKLRNVCLIIGAISYMYLVIMGVIGATKLLLRYVTKSKAISIIISILGMLIFPFVVMMIGFVYVTNLGELFPKVDMNNEERKTD